MLNLEANTFQFFNLNIRNIRVRLRDDILAAVTK